MNTAIKRAFDKASLQTTCASLISLVKPRILFMVVLTATLGFLLSCDGKDLPLLLLGYLCVGTAMACAGSNMLNCYIEREYDARMERTKNRPLVTGAVAPETALFLGEVLVLGGVVLLVVKVSLLVGFLSLLSSFVYVLVYTPLKRRTWLNTMIGAIPGALPPLAGWLAAGGEMNLCAIALFLLLFTWQQPHFFAIAYMYKEDYKKAGFKMLPVVDPDGRATLVQSVLFSVALFIVSLAIGAYASLGMIYLMGATVLGFMMIQRSFALGRTPEYADAKRLLRTSVLYLPAYFMVVMADFIV
ncbi:MAG: protoheme IX farnesyltransferase [Candidatus Dadabacteria bacterium]|nr:MAG: protoheme IX farnesyltransferase [Candidatus Dadabacteria bacterium]